MPSWKPPSLLQPSEGYRHSADAFLLAGFARRFQPRFFADLGTGSGVVAYALASATGSAGIAIEREACMATYARENLRELPVTHITGDIRSFPWATAVFDVVVCNPPYFTLGQGKISWNERVARARHTFFGDVVAFAQALRGSLKPGGSFCFIFPKDRLDGVLKPLLAAGWFLKETLEIHSFLERPARLVCVALCQTQQESLKSSLVMYHGHRDYTEEAILLLDPFRCKQGAQ